MKRQELVYLTKWFHQKRRMPIILRGARQVGKSTLVKLFSEQEDLELVTINLEKEKIRSVNSDRFEISRVIDEIQLKHQKKITSKTLIFFDEIQEQPSLLKALRFFYEEAPDIAVVAAGSLLEIALKDEKFSFPVGRVEFLHLGPMRFKEFLWATGKEILAEKIEKKDFSPEVCELAYESYKMYMYIGGMPLAVKTFVETNSLLPVRHIQEQIIQTYQADFPKYNPRVNLQRIQRIFASVASQVGKKVVYQRFDSISQSKDIRRVIELLIDARVVLPCYHTEGSSVPLAGLMDDSIYKLYFLDIGLLSCLLRIDFDMLDLQLKNNFNSKGVVAEQFVAQHLAYLSGPSLQPKLFYWLRDKGIQKGEVDFLIENKNQVVPIEVKSSAIGHLKSLFLFAKEKNKSRAYRLSLLDPGITVAKHRFDDKDYEVMLENLPIWAVESLEWHPGDIDGSAHS